jgi:hypothetical protein
MQVPANSGTEKNRSAFNQGDGLSINDRYQILKISGSTHSRKLKRTLGVTDPRMTGQKRKADVLSLLGVRPQGRQKACRSQRHELPLLAADETFDS